MKSVVRFASVGAGTFAADQEYCRALVLSGGGSLGSWEAGILWGLANYSQNPSDFFYDVNTGVSAGAMNAAFLAGWAPE